jgi:hypothetical protein
MRIRKLLMFFSMLLLSAFSCAKGEQRFHRVSLCAISENPKRFLHSDVEVHALLIVTFEASHLKEGTCSFRYAFGDDYQTFGHRFTVKRDDQWTLMMKYLNSPTNSSLNVRIIKARIRGTVARMPATGVVPENEMPFEIVIQSVYEVENLPISLSPASVPSPNPSSPERK